MIDEAAKGHVRTALPAPGAHRSWQEVLRMDPAAAVSLANIEAYYRERAKTAHPDAPGGSHDAMAELNRARDEALKAVRA